MPAPSASVDLGALLDRVRVDHPVRGDALETQQGQLGIRCDVEAAALLGERADDLAMGERLHGVVEAHGREGGLQAAELPAHAVGVQQQEWRAVRRERGTGLIHRQQRGGLRATAVDERVRRSDRRVRLVHDAFSSVAPRSPVRSVTVNAPAAIA